MDLKEKAKDIFDSAKQPLFDLTCDLVLEGVVGSVVPGVMNTYLSYKQKRQEKMFIKFMEEIESKIEILEERLKNMTPENYTEFRDKYFGLVSDYVLDEVQEEKIKYITKGFINLSQVNHINEDFVLTYYDTLKDLRIMDIAVLNLYYDIYNPFSKSEKTFHDILVEYHIDYDQYTAIREKLVRLGVLTTKRENRIDDLYNNILNMQDYLENTYKGKKVKLKPFKRIDKKDSFQISKFGREFIDFFISEI